MLSHIILRSEVSVITRYPYQIIVKVYNIYFISNIIYRTLSLSYFLYLFTTNQHLSHIPPIYNISIKINTKYCKSQTYEHI